MLESIFTSPGISDQGGIWPPPIVKRVNAPKCQSCVHDKPVAKRIGFIGLQENGLYDVCRRVSKSVPRKVFEII